MAEIFQLCSILTEENFSDSSYYRDYFKANIKFDGERIMANLQNNDVVLINRNKKACNLHFPEIVNELKKLASLGDFILDGEIMSKDDDFNKLQKRALTKSKEKQEELIKEIPIVFMIFDVLNYEGVSLRNSMLKERLKYLDKLKQLIEDNSLNFIQIAEYSSPKDMYDKARKEGREGIVVKHLSRTYFAGRNSSWYKLKFFKEEVFEVVGYTENPSGIRVTDIHGNAVQINDSHVEEIKSITKDIAEGGKVLINIQYLSKTENGRYRFPSFRGLGLNEENQNS